MFDLGLFFRGLLIGLAIAAPVGPIALLCMKRTLRFGPGLGYATGLGAATADGIYGAIAAFGVAAISDFLLHYQYEFRLIGGFVLLFMAARIWFKRNTMPVLSDAIEPVGTRYRAFFSAMILTATNPLTLVAFIAILTTLGLSQVVTEFDSAITLLAGLYMGAILWWSILSSGVGLVRDWINDRTLRRIDLFAAFGLLAFGVYAVITAIQQLV